jgi:homeobox protein HoxA/B2
MDSKQFVGKLAQYPQGNRSYENYGAALQGAGAEQHAYSRGQAHGRQQDGSPARPTNGIGSRQAYPHEMYQNYGYPAYGKDQVGYGHPGYDQSQSYGEHMGYPNNHYSYHYHDGQHDHAHNYYGSEAQKNAHGTEYSKNAYYDTSAYASQQGGTTGSYAAGGTSNEGDGSNAGDCSDGYGSFQQFYEATHATPTGDNSNSSSDFHFLSNLANDFAPEYYTIWDKDFAEQASDLFV